jgi:hypothetical protein
MGELGTGASFTSWSAGTAYALVTELESGRQNLCRKTSILDADDCCLPRHSAGPRHTAKRAAMWRVPGLGNLRGAR